MSLSEILAVLLNYCLEKFLPFLSCLLHQPAKWIGGDISLGSQSELLLLLYLSLRTVDLLPPASVYPLHR